MQFELLFIACFEAEDLRGHGRWTIKLWKIRKIRQTTSEASIAIMGNENKPAVTFNCIRCLFSISQSCFSQLPCWLNDEGGKKTGQTTREGNFKLFWGIWRYREWRRCFFCLITAVMCPNCSFEFRRDKKYLWCNLLSGFCLCLLWIDDDDNDSSFCCFWAGKLKWGKQEEKRKCQPLCNLNSSVTWKFLDDEVLSWRRNVAWNETCGSKVDEGKKQLES